jgi:hypothetical protein
VGALQVLGLRRAAATDKRRFWFDKVSDKARIVKLQHCCFRYMSETLGLGRDF